jgi:hypothetical protein
MLFARIDLYKTNYSQLDNWKYIPNPDTAELDNIYHTYCRYKKFRSFMPIFDSEYTDPKNDIIGYYHKEKLVAFSLITRYNKHNAECVQFAWNYATPGLHLGLKSLRNECSIYKERGYKYLYLGGADEYKKNIDGFEITGPI